MALVTMITTSEETFNTIIRTLAKQRDQAIKERDAARDLCCKLEFALHDLGAWNPGEPGRPDKVGTEMISWDLDRRGVASIERAR